ncbi:MHYT domain-containing protein [Sinobaca sp. H24]|uniref:MHYT domain-containing protein n=1 Tax=Sinobaca sp. H24 TaxID=2923376 RepID=UPI0035AF3034
MHIIGMMAVHLGIPVEYQSRLLIVSFGAGLARCFNSFLGRFRLLFTAWSSSFFCRGMYGQCDCRHALYRNGCYGERNDYI